MWYIALLPSGGGKKRRVHFFHCKQSDFLKRDILPWPGEVTWPSQETAVVGVLGLLLFGVGTCITSWLPRALVVGDPRTQSGPGLFTSLSYCYFTLFCWLQRKSLLTSHCPSDFHRLRTWWGFEGCCAREQNHLLPPGTPCLLPRKAFFMWWEV